MRKPNIETIREQCSCGATFEYAGPHATFMINRWRENHICPRRPHRRAS